MDCPYPQCKRCKKAYNKLRARIAELEAEIKDGWMVSHEIMERKVEELEAEIAKLTRIAQDEVIGGDKG